MTERMKQKLTSFMVSAMMAFLGSASPALLASDTASPKDLKQGSGGELDHLMHFGDLQAVF